jgi:hypothetical protein
MKVTKNKCLQESYIGQEIAEVLAIDYDENQLLAKEFSDKERHQRKETLPDVK